MSNFVEIDYHRVYYDPTVTHRVIFKGSQQTRRVWPLEDGTYLCIRHFKHAKYHVCIQTKAKRLTKVAEFRCDWYNHTVTQTETPEGYDTAIIYRNQVITRFTLVSKLIHYEVGHLPAHVPLSANCLRSFSEVKEGVLIIGSRDVHLFSYASYLDKLGSCLIAEPVFPILCEYLGLTCHAERLTNLAVGKGVKRKRTPDEQVAHVEAQLVGERQRIADLANEVGQHKRTVHRLEDTIERLQAQISVAQRSLNTARKTLETLDTKSGEMVAKETELNEARRQLVRTRKRLLASDI